MNTLVAIAGGATSGLDLALLFIKMLFVATIAVVFKALFSFLYMLFIRPFFDPLRHIPGPEGAYFQTHLRQVMDPTLSYRTHADWTKRFGQTFRVHGFGRHDYRLLTFDFRSIVHILSSSAFEKPWQTRSFLTRLLGRGIFAMEGAEHRFQRRILAPAFSQQSIRNLAPIFFRKAEEICEHWKNEIGPPVKLEDEIEKSVQSSGPRIDVSRWIMRGSFDVVGLAVLNYDFHALQDESEGVYTAYRRMFDIADKGLDLWRVLQLYFPILRKIFVDDDIRVTNECLTTINRAGTNIIHQKRTQYLEAQEHGMESKDLLTLLIKSNLSADISQRLTDQELFDQCSTFLHAGSDTFAMALTWAIYLLSQHPDIQTKLRQEIRKVYSSVDGYHSDTSLDSGFEDCVACNRHALGPTEWSQTCSCLRTRMDAIENLPYLDSVVRETLRFCPAVHATIRVATRDDRIPLSHPVTLRNGQTVGTDLSGYIEIKKGSYIHIPIEGFSYTEDIWGPDALEFKPERWKHVQEWDPSKPGIHNLLSFGYGPHSCLGHRWAIAEMKIFLAVLLSSFEFLPVEGVQIVKGNSVLTRPYVKGEKGPQLPLVVREVK